MYPSYEGIPFLIWCMACLPSLIGGIIMLGNAGWRQNWPSKAILLIATLTLKTVVTSTAFITLIFLAIPQIPLLIVLGPGVTALIIWGFRSTIPVMPRLALALLLILDALRWGSTMILFGQRFYLDAPRLWIAIAMPTVFLIGAWLLVIFGRRAPALA